MANWQINEAKNRFSELLEDANSKGPQVITRHGAERAVVLSMSEYRELTAKRPDFKAHLLKFPKVDNLELDRDKDTGRLIDLSGQ